MSLIDIAFETDDEDPAWDIVGQEKGDGIQTVALSGQRYEHYEICSLADGSLWELGRGAMGITYKAFDTNLQRLAALKIINGALTDDPKARERFLREARAAARLRHPNVATILHWGREGNAYFYAMEFIEGETLEAFITRRGTLPPPLALEITAQTARALDAAQREGLVHRDIKPANIMLARSCGEEMDEGAVYVKVIDFGLAKLTAESTNNRFVWGLRYFAGTPHFASPEQLAGETVDCRSDIYSLGAALRYMLAGAVVEKEDGNPTSERLAKLPKSVLALLDEMLAFDKASRPRSAAAALADIEQTLADLPMQRRQGASHRKRNMLALSLFLALVGSVVAGFTQMKRMPVPSTQTIALALPPSGNASEIGDQRLASQVLDDLAGALGKNDALKVVRLSPQEASRYAAWPNDAKGEAPAAKWLLKESIERSNDVLRVGVHLYDISTRTSVWADVHDYDSQSADKNNIATSFVRIVLKSLEAGYLPNNQRSESFKTVDSIQTNEILRLGYEQVRKHTFEGVNQAIVHYQRALELSPNSPRAHAALAEAYAQQVFRFGYPPERMELALQSANKAIALAPMEATGYASLGMIYSVSDRHLEALEQYRKAIEIAPDYAGAMRAFGVLWLKLGKPDKGMPWLHAATRLTPEEPTSWFTLGECYKDFDDFKTATECFEKSMNSESFQVVARISLAHILLSEGKIEQARQECAGAMLIQPNNVSSLCLAALVEFYSGNYAKAESMYRRLLQIKRSGNIVFYGGIRYLSALGYIRCQLGDNAEGEALMDEAAKLDEESQADEFQGLYDLAAIRCSQGRSDEGLSLLEHAVESGWVDYYAIGLDPRFRVLNDSPRFANLISELRGKIARLREETLAAIHKPLTLADYPLPTRGAEMVGK